MNNILSKIEKFFNLRFGWFFVNGNKLKKWNKFLKEKYLTEEKN
jgi:hypothetical protein